MRTRGGGKEADGALACVRETYKRAHVRTSSYTPTENVSGGREKEKGDERERKPLLLDRVSLFQISGTTEAR